MPPKAAKKKPATTRLPAKRGVSKRDAFLAAFRLTASITAAAKAAKIQRSMHYRWLQEEPAYAEAFEAAKEEAAQTLEDEAVRRAYQGVRRPVFYKGRRIAIVREYSDRLMEFLLKGWRPEKYKDRVQNELIGADELIERLAAGRRRVKQAQ